MADIITVPPLLRFGRSPQSGIKTMTAAYATVFTDSSLAVYIFAGAVIDLSAMLAGDHIDIEVDKVVIQGGAFIPHDIVGYDNAQPVGHLAVRITAIPDVYGVRIQMRQTVGVLRDIPTEFIVAKRIGT